MPLLRRNGGCLATLVLVLLLSEGAVAKRSFITYGRKANWSELVTQPSVFVAKALKRLRSRDEGFQPGPTCAKYVGYSYLDEIRKSKRRICGPASYRKMRQLSASSAASSVDCYTAPFAPIRDGGKAAISLCHSRNLVLDTCSFYAGRRGGKLTKKFPMPAEGAVKLACEMANITELAATDDAMGSIAHEVWWSNATRDDYAVAETCAAGSSKLVTTPTMFVMRDRHANYAHEMEVVSVAFAFLSALELPEVQEHGIQVVIVDQAPMTGFLENWARISYPHRLRMLAHDPFPPGTCFKTALHVYSFAAGIGYNTNPETIKCESPVITGFSHWLRQLYGESEMGSSGGMHHDGMSAHTPAGGFVVKNVVWLSRKNLELVRLLLHESASWKSMRLVRNEEEVQRGLMEAVQEWNAENCLMKRFDGLAVEEYRRSFDTVASFRFGTNGTIPDAGDVAVRKKRDLLARRLASMLLGHDVDDGAFGEEGDELGGLGRRALLDKKGGGSANGDGKLSGRQRRLGSDHNIDVHEGDSGGDDDDADRDGESDADTSGDSAYDESSRPQYIVGSNVIALEKLWEEDTGSKCRKTNVLFKFVDGDFNDMPYHQQLNQVFRTGVLVGVHGAGLTHGFFMPPGQSAVLQLLGQSFAQVAANNVFRNMAVGGGNYYEDVLYDGIDVDVRLLKQAAKRAMDYVSEAVHDAQQRLLNGPLRLTLDDQAHFQIVVPPAGVCPRDDNGQGAEPGSLDSGGQADTASS